MNDYVSAYIQGIATGLALASILVVVLSKVVGG